MIGLLAKIPFHSQLRKADPRLCAELEAAAAAATRELAARPIATDGSFLLSFEEGSRPFRLRAAEAASALAAAFAAVAPRLHGWNIVLERLEGGDEDAFSRLNRLWYSLPGDGLFVGPAAAPLLEGYFVLGETIRGGCAPATGRPYASPVAATEEFLPRTETQILERLTEELGELGIGASGHQAIAAVGPGRTPVDAIEAALALLYPADAPTFLRLSAPSTAEPDFGPLLRALSPVGLPPGIDPEAVDRFLPDPDRALLAGLGPLVGFFRRSPYREGCSPDIETRLRLGAGAAVRLYARERRSRGLPAFVLLEGADLFPSPSLALMASLAEGGLEREGLAILATCETLPPFWPLAATRALSIPGPSALAVAEGARRAAGLLGAPEEAAGLAAAAQGDPFRLALAARLVSVGAPCDHPASTAALAAAALGTFPLEYAELLLALRLSEDVLTDEGLDGFLDSIGYVSGIRPLVFSTLERMGFVGGGTRPRIRRREGAGQAELAIEDGGRAMAAAFRDRLRALHGRGEALPSLALFKRTEIPADGAGAGDVPAGGIAAGGIAALRFYVDCVAAEETYGPSLGEGRAEPPSPLATYARFRAACMLRDREGAMDATVELEREAAAARSQPSPQGPGSATLVIEGTAALARASCDYAERRPAAAASRAKAALMALHSAGMRRDEARAHRILGLCALGQEQVLESSDYLANAFDIAESLPDPLECILAAQAEAAAQLVLGDFGRAQTRLSSAASWATRAFRADWETACAFERGRVAFELGSLSEAERRFGETRAGARVYGYPEAGRRAEIWAGRAASWAGETARARACLARYPEDPEALWFRAELEAWEADWQEAASLAAGALERLPPPSFSPAESFSWEDGFAPLEGRAAGFASGRGILGDQILAFAAYAAGMAACAAGDRVEAAERAERLASLAREERLSLLHPFVHLYFFYRYRILQAASPGSMDGSAALSKAFKALQQRAARMSEASLKDSFLEGNRWNRSLFAEARARKLI